MDIFSNQHNFMVKWNFSILFDVLWSWDHVLFISEVFVCSPPTTHGIPVRKSDDRPSKRHQKANQNHDQNTGFLCRISSCCLGFMVDNTMWLVVNTKTLQKWRVRGLSFIKHQTLLKNSTWAWSYVDLEKVPFFFNGNLWFLCWPKIWQWYTSKPLYGHVGGQTTESIRAKVHVPTLLTLCFRP